MISGLGVMECELSELSEPVVAVDSQEEICEGSCVSRAKRPKTVKRVYKQKYNKSWEDDPLLKGWLSAVKADPYKASCKACADPMVIIADVRFTYPRAVGCLKSYSLRMQQRKSDW